MGVLAPRRCQSGFVAGGRGRRVQRARHFDPEGGILPEAATELAPLTDRTLQVSDSVVARCLMNTPRRPARWDDARLRLSASPSCSADRLLVLWQEGALESGIDAGTARVTVRSGADDDLETVLRTASDPRTPSVALHTLGSSEQTRVEKAGQRGNREVSVAIPLAAVQTAPCCATSNCR